MDSGQYVNDFLSTRVDGSSEYTFVRSATVTVPQITSDVLSSGLVITYLLIPPVSYSSEALSPTPLPYTWKRFVNAGLNQYYLGTYGAQVLPGAVKFYYYPTDATVPAPDVHNLAVPTQTFKIYILSGAAAQAASARHLNLSAPTTMQQFAKSFQ